MTAENGGMTDSRKRQPRGIPTGGEFAANMHDEASSELGAEENELISMYFERVTEHGGDPVSDARDIIESIEAGAFDGMHDESSI